MLGNLTPSLCSLDEDERAKLAEVIRDRNEYLEQLIKLNELRLVTLANPTEANETAANDFNSTVVAPLRDKHMASGHELLREAVNLEGIKALMPIVAMGLLQSVNPTLALAATGAEPDLIERAISAVSEFIKSDK